MVSELEYFVEKCLRVIFQGLLLNVFFYLLLIHHLFDVLKNLLALVIQLILDNKLLISVFLFLKIVVIRIHMVPALKSVGVDKTKFLVKHNSAASFLADLFESVLGLHVFSRKYALIEVKVDAVLTQHFWVYLTLYLLDKLVNRISKDEVALEGRMGMKVEVHEQSFIFIVVLT